MRGFKFIFLLVPVCAYTQAPPKFTIQDLGGLPGMPNCTGVALSQSGSVVGYCAAAAGAVLNSQPTRGFLYSNGTLKDLGPAAQPIVLPTAVNDAGLIVGTSFSSANGQGAYGPFVYQNGKIQSLPGANIDFLPFALNNAGKITGSQVLIFGIALKDIARGQAYVVSQLGASPAALADPPGLTQSGALGLSPNGDWIAGLGGNARSTVVSPVLWHNGAAQALPMLPALDSTIAISVNDSGVAVGGAFTINLALDYDPAGIGHGVLFKNGAATDLSTLTSRRTNLPIWINNSGWIVGYNSDQAPHGELQLAAIVEAAETWNYAFLYVNGKMYELNQLLTNGSGWQLSYATMVNDAGQIVGTGIYQGQQRAFLLTPVVPPQINSVAGAGLSVPPVATLASNGLFSIFGTQFAAAGVSRSVGASDIVNNTLPTNLADTCVQGGSGRWGLTFVSPAQINAVAGTLPASGTVPVQVITNCGQANELATAAFNVKVAGQSPEFLYFVLNADGKDPVAVIQAVSGAYVGPANLIPGATFTPAHANDVLTAFGVGWGPTDPSVTAGSLASGIASLAGKNYSLTVGGVTAQVLYAGITPSYAGLYQVNFIVPAGLASGNQPIVLTVNGVSSPAGAFLTIE